jgi:hypothetical protein
VTEPHWFESPDAEPPEAETPSVAAAGDEAPTVEPLRVESFEATGNAAVDATIGALGEAASLTPKEQVAAYAEAHQALQETLQTIEEH